MTYRLFRFIPPPSPDVDLSSSDASVSQKANLREHFQAYRHVFGNFDSELGLANVPPHEIDVDDARPIESISYRVPSERRKLQKRSGKFWPLISLNLQMPVVARRY